MPPEDRDDERVGHPDPAGAHRDREQLGEVGRHDAHEAAQIAASSGCPSTPWTKEPTNPIVPVQKGIRVSRPAPTNQFRRCIQAERQSVPPLRKPRARHVISDVAFPGLGAARTQRPPDRARQFVVSLDAGSAAQHTHWRITEQSCVTGGMRQFRLATTSSDLHDKPARLSFLDEAITQPQLGRGQFHFNIVAGQNHSSRPVQEHRSG